MFKNKKIGFTLVELLVVIAIIGILVALLLPAIQMAREAGRRTECTNNLKQVALACENYHSTYKMFPPGSITEGPHPTTRSLTNWSISILPFMGEEGLYDMYNQKSFNEDAVNDAFRIQKMKSYACPSDLNTDVLVTPESGVRRAPCAPGSYRAVTGVSDGTCFGDSDLMGVFGSFCYRNRGVLHQVGTQGHSCESQKNLTDGSSTTLLVGEYHTKTHQRRRTMWAYSHGPYNKSCVVVGAPAAFGLADYDKCVTSPGSGGVNACRRAFASMHPGIVMFGIADGSTRPISTDIEQNVLIGLATIDGKEVISLP